MNQLRKKSISALVLTAVLLVFCVFMLCPKPVNSVQSLPGLGGKPAAAEYLVSVFDANAFTYGQLGLYLTRPEKPSKNNVYYGTISTEEIIGSKQEFYPTFRALVRHDDQWYDITDDQDADFYIRTDEDQTNYSVTWYLKESAPAAVYGVRCTYEEEQDGYTETVDVEFQILYTQDWTYINVTNDEGVRRISNFTGGRNLTLYLNVTFNDGAADPILREAGADFSTGASKGKLESNNIVSTNTMQINVKTVSGKVYTPQNLMYEIDVNKNNRVAIRFLEQLSNDIYMVQFTSNADNRIIGQFIIDNSDMQSGVNLSNLWVVLMIFGGLLALGAASAYLVPFLIVKVNETRVYKENERVARMKNPEAYANKNKKKTSFKEAIDKLIYNIKTPVYKRKKDAKEEEAQTEEKEYTNRFTEMLRERQEKRDFMREHNVTSAEMEKMQEAEAAAAADKANSFASLRDDDDDDEIATFRAAQDEISTLETGSYVQGGTTFAKLDSMRDYEPEQIVEQPQPQPKQPQGDSNDDGNNDNDGN